MHNHMEATALNSPYKKRY